MLFIFLKTGSCTPDIRINVTKPKVSIPGFTVCFVLEDDLHIYLNWLDTGHWIL